MSVAALSAAALVAAAAPTEYAFVASGGISLGSYQAGVSYAFLRYLLERESDRAPDRAGAELTIATGASAGNINAFLAALTWYQADAANTLSPTRNLFWNTWINIGWDKLSPPDPRACQYIRSFGEPLGEGSPYLTLPSCKPARSVYTDADGLLTRQAFRVAEDDLLGRLSSTGQYEQRRKGLLVGVTITKSVPELERVQDVLGYKYQRFAIPLSIGVAKCGPDGCQLSVRNETQGGLVGEAGHVLHLPTDCDADGVPGEEVSREAIRGVIEASSAFPIAFSPVPLHVRAPGEVPYCVTTEGEARLPTKKPSSDRAGGAPVAPRLFYDGGVFDNVPLGLALQLAKKSVPTYFYVHPDHVRAGLELPRNPFRKRGTAFLRNMVANYIDEGRRYELQGVYRFKKAAIAGRDGTGFVASSRFFPVMGEYLGSFGAFMARTYRVHDYFVGLYDGIFTIATQIEGGRDVADDPPYAPATWNSRDWRRLVDRFERLLVAIVPPDEVVPRDKVPLPVRALLRSMFVYELRWTSTLTPDEVDALVWEREPQGEPRMDVETSWCASPVWAVHRTLREIDSRSRVLARDGTREQIAAHAELAGSFQYFLQRVSARSTDRALPAACTQPRADTLPDADNPGVPVEYDPFAKRYRGLEAWSFATVDRLFLRAIDIETNDQTSNANAGRALPLGALSIARAAAASIMERESEQLDLDPSSVSRIKGGMSWVAAFQFFPFYLSNDVAGDKVELGWEPKIRPALWDGFYMPFGFAWSRSIPRLPQGYSYGQRFTLFGIGYDPAGRLLDDLQLAAAGWRTGRSLSGDLLPDPFHIQTYGLEASLQIATKLRLALGFRSLLGAGVPDAWSTRFSKPYFAIGLVDLNALLALGARGIAWLLGASDFGEQSSGKRGEQ